ncbi:TetR family transcriptional regulator [Saccharospirillum sp. MSK14-1]|uniref:TetR/AcrR family transcriptional regulator n=1 Tax=Saccharospirillum sp. MSK14-1 TaxID=1897632 RepID=UPI000D3664FC|nr:TetR/AcrR family transcriptional regulator [Saccharospirillum sp. MSK14-1]PTY38844.1 TetR family transcriptional regulator [Saccharospirillum sp. MSK14-1]
MTVTKKRLSERKHQAILDAAAEEFMEFGFQGANMDRVASRAEVSKRTVYNHFASKESLFESITRQIWHQAQTATDVPFQADVAIADQLLNIAERELALLESPHYLRLTAVVLAEFARSQELATQARDWVKQEESGARRWMDQAVAAGRLNTDDAETATTQFFSLIKGRAFWPQMIEHAPIPTAAEQARIAQSSVALFLDHYGLKDDR